MLNKVTSIFFIPEKLNKKENKVKILKKSKILSPQVIDQVSCSIVLDNNNGFVEVKIGKMGSYLGV